MIKSAAHFQQSSRCCFYTPLTSALTAAVNQQSDSWTNQLAAGHYRSRLHYLSTFIFLTDYFHAFKHRIASLEPKNMQVLWVKVAEPLKITGLQKLSLTHMICVKAVFFLQMGTGSMLCECVLTVCVFDSTSLRTVCLKHDVPLLVSSDHMKHASLSDLLAVLLLSSLFSYTASLWRSGCLGPNLFKKHCAVQISTDPTLDIKRQA